MARMTSVEMDAYIDATNGIVGALIPDGGLNTAANMRTALATDNARFKEVIRNGLDKNPCHGVVYQIGSDPDNHFTMALLAAGSGQGYSDTGYQLVKMITGNGTQAVPANPTGGSTPSDPFDGVSELKAGILPATENMMEVGYSGQFTVTGQTLTTPTSGTNKQIETDVALFDENGDYVTILNILASVNGNSPDKINTNVIYPAVINNPVAIPQGHHLGLVIRRNASESAFSVLVRKAVLGVTMTSLEQSS